MDPTMHEPGMNNEYHSESPRRRCSTEALTSNTQTSRQPQTPPGLKTTLSPPEHLLITTPPPFNLSPATYQSSSLFVCLWSVPSGANSHLRGPAKRTPHSQLMLRPHRRHRRAANGHASQRTPTIDVDTHNSGRCPLTMGALPETRAELFFWVSPTSSR